MNSGLGVYCSAVLLRVFAAKARHSHASMRHGSRAKHTCSQSLSQSQART